MPASVTGASRVTLILGGGRPLPHGRYLLIVKSGGVRDRAGRALDGEFTSGLPSGNGVAGGDFQGRFQFNRTNFQPLAAPIVGRTGARVTGAHATRVRGGCAI